MRNDTSGDEPIVFRFLDIFHVVHLFSEIPNPSLKRISSNFKLSRGGIRRLKSWWFAKRNINYYFWRRMVEYRWSWRKMNIWTRPSFRYSVCSSGWKEFLRGYRVITKRNKRRLLSRKVQPVTDEIREKFDYLYLRATDTFSITPGVFRLSWKKLFPRRIREV